MCKLFKIRKMKKTNNDFKTAINGFSFIPKSGSTKLIEKYIIRNNKTTTNYYT